MIRLLAKIQRKNQASVDGTSNDLKEKPTVEDRQYGEEGHSVELIKEEAIGMPDLTLNLQAGGRMEEICLALTTAALSPLQKELDESGTQLQHHHNQKQESKWNQELLGDVDETAHVGMEASLVSNHAVIKEGYLEKKGHSTAFFMWPKCVVLACVLCDVYAILWG